MKDTKAIGLFFIGILVIVGGVFLAMNQMTGEISEEDQVKEDREVQTSRCPDDRLSDLDVQYSNEESDSSSAVETDVRIYQKVNGEGDLVYSATDDTSDTYGSYETIENKLLCGQDESVYDVYLGDETEEYYRMKEVTVDSPLERTLISDGADIGGVSYTGYEDGQSEDTLNVTLGSGEDTSAVEVKVKENESNSALEAEDGFMLIFGYNGSIFDSVDVTNLGAKEVSCPAGAGDLVENDDTTDGTKKCWVIDNTYLGSFDEFRASLFIDVAGGEDPDGDAIDMAVADQNHYVDGDDGDVMKYGYFDENDEDIGATNLDTITINTA